MVIEYKSFASKRYFGIELECSANITQNRFRDIIEAHSSKPIRVSNYEQSLNNNFWHIKPDSTCGENAHLNKDGRDYGIELASYKAKGIKHLNHIGDIAKFLKDGGAKVNKNCGFHIHVDVSDYSVQDIGKLLANWIKLEPIICSAVPAKRLSGIHCKPWNITHDFSASGYLSCGTLDISKLWNLVKPTNFGAYGNPQKRMTLNFVNIAYAIYLDTHGGLSSRRTVELRIPPGTLEKREIVNWVKFFLFLVDFSKKSKTPTDLKTISNIDAFMSYIGLEDESGFIILSHGLYNMKKWFLEKIQNNTKNKTIYKKITQKLENITKIH